MGRRTFCVNCLPKFIFVTVQLITMQREEKQLETTLEDLAQKVSRIKAAISSLILRLEQDYMTLNWPTVLDNFAVISGELNSLISFLKSEKVPPLRNYAFIPVALAHEPDTELEKLTERRVKAFNHEVVPDYLRTKLVPEVEEKASLVFHRANSLSADNLMKQINMLNKISANVVEMIKTKREDWETEMNRSSSLPQTSSPTDSQKLIAAVSFGKSLKPGSRRLDPSMAGASSHMSNQGLVSPGGSNSSHSMQSVNQGMQMNKGPGAVKTTVKTASHPHPYGR